MCVRFVYILINTFSSLKGHLHSDCIKVKNGVSWVFALHKEVAHPVIVTLL